MANDRITFNFGMRTHTDQFRDMHETVFKNRFSDHASPFCHQIQQTELRLHIGRKARVWRGTEIHRFRATPVHVETDPIFTDFNISTGFSELG